MYGDEQGYRSSDTEFMAELKLRLSKEKIPFREDRFGFVFYPRKDADKVERLIEAIQGERLRRVGLNFGDPEANAYLQTLLKERGLSYQVETVEGEEWIFWRPENEAQRWEIERQVVQFIRER